LKKKTQLSKVIIGILIITLLGGLVGCKSKNTAQSKEENNTENITLSIAWWGNDKRQALTEEAIKLFQKDHPNVKFEMTSYASTGDIKLGLAMNTADQKMPDIMQTDMEFATNYIKRDLFEPLDTYIQQNILNVLDIDKSYLETGYYNNQLYGVPLGVNAYCMDINPLVFQKVGVDIPKNGYTYDDLYKVAKELKSKIDDPEFYPIANFVDFNSFVRAKGGMYFNADGTALGYEDDQIYVDFVKTQKKWQEEGLIAPNSSNTKNDLFTSGKSAFIFAVSNGAADFSKKANTVIKIISVPSATTGKITSCVRPSQFFSVSAYSKHKKEAVEFINFIINDLDVNNILKGERGVPVSSKVNDALEQKMSEADKQQYAFMKYIKDNPSPANPPSPNSYGSVNTLLSRLSDDVLKGAVSPEASAKDFREKANKILKGVKGE
jgi:multiple sugar transport system substrate-binding protein